MGDFSSNYDFHYIDANQKIDISSSHTESLGFVTGNSIKGNSISLQFVTSGTLYGNLGENITVSEIQRASASLIEKMNESKFSDNPEIRESLANAKYVLVKPHKSEAFLEKVSLEFIPVKTERELLELNSNLGVVKTSLLTNLGRTDHQKFIALEKRIHYKSNIGTDGITSSEILLRERRESY